MLTVCANIFLCLRTPDYCINNILLENRVFRATHFCTSTIDILHVAIRRNAVAICKGLLFSFSDTRSLRGRDVKLKGSRRVVHGSTVAFKKESESERSRKMAPPSESIWRGGRESFPLTRVPTYLPVRERDSTMRRHSFNPTNPVAFCSLF